MSTEKNLILDKKQIIQKIKRIAIEIYERNYKEKEIVIAGIDPMGYKFAQLIEKELKDISEMETTLVRVTLDKDANTQCEIKLDKELSQIKGKSVVLTDDVLNTGRAMTYSLQPFLGLKLKKLQTAVLVDRNHRSFPVSADFVGYSLATTLKEHIEVSFDKSDFGVYLH